MSYKVPNDLKITLAAARVNAGMTQREVAAILGVSTVTLIKWEHGKGSPSIAQAETMRKLYKRPPDSIIFLY